MTLEGSLFRSKIARRTVVLFILAVFVPIMAAAMLSLGEIQRLLVEQSHTRLTEANARYAVSLHERLLAARQELQEFSARENPVAIASADEQARLRRQFKAIGMADGAGPIVNLLSGSGPAPHLESARLEPLAKGGALLSSSGGARGPARIFLVVAAARDDAPTLVAEIDPAYLWGDRAVLPATGLCVIDDRGWRLLCTQEAGLAAVQHLTTLRDVSASGAFSFEYAGEAYLANTRELVLKRDFGIRGWSLVATKLEADAFAPIAAFESVLLPMAAIALIVVALLSIIQIRRTVGPIQKLIDGTRRVAEQDFSTRVIVPGGDEFGELAVSFNSMAARLGSQFTALLTLSDIDQAILSRLDLDRVIETVVMRMRDIVPADYVSLAIIDRNAPEMVRIYTRDQRHEGGLELERCACSSADTRVLLAHPEGLWIDRMQAVKPYLAPVAKLGASVLLVLPIVWQNTVVGTVVLGFRGAAILTDEERGRARNLGDRVGVAFATAAKDEQLYYQANYDALTALPNRLYFKDQLARRLAQAQRERRQFALLFIDLDNFKGINDRLGHAAGDEVLRQTAERLKQCVRETDTVTRLGGDEFTIILPHVRSARDSESVAEHVIASMEAPLVVAGDQHFLSASIGIALYPADGLSADDLLRNADTAMYRAKENGRGRYVYFEERMNVAALARVNLEKDLRRAIECNEFSLVFQPQLDLATGRMVGAEALLRWNPPGQEQRTPAEFIQLAEETGLIEPIGDWVLREACRQFRAWQIEGVAAPLIAVNVSARQFRQKGFVEKTRSILGSAGIAPQCLELEIKESLLVDATSGVAAMLDELTKMGVTLSLDDFGTGSSSLASLARFPLATVKIDRAFVADLGTDEDAGAIASAVIAMAHALNKRVLAEGVETEIQAAVLARLGCDHIQGHYVSRPLDAAQLAEFIRQSAAGAPKRPSPITRIGVRV